MMTEIGVEASSTMDMGNVSVDPSLDFKSYKEDEAPKSFMEGNTIADDISIREAPVGKGIAGALKLLKDRGALKETEAVDRVGRNMDKIKNINDDAAGEKEKEKEIRIERVDEFGRTVTLKEAFRLLSHKFHGKGPGKKKQQKRQKRYQDELRVKEMIRNSESVERMREAQSRMKTPYLILSANFKP